MELWENLSRIGVNRKDSWCIFGDFNDILHNGEKIGGSWRSDESFEPFNLMVKACKVQKLQSHGDDYTWSGNRNNSWVHTRLDRCSGNKAWFQKFPCSNQTFLDKCGSDHRPVLIHLMQAQESYRGRFRFDTRILEMDGIQETVANAWEFPEARGTRSLSSRLKACRNALSNLKRQVNVNSRDKIHKAEMALEREQYALSPSTHRIYILKKDLIKAQKDEETYWWQRSRDKWFNRGDRNSTFFHNSVKAARARKHIDKLLTAEGVAVYSEAAKGEVAVDFFSNLFKSSNPQPFEELFHDMRSRVSTQMNEELIKRVSVSEVREAVFSIHPSKALGPDGMSALFFQKF